MGGVRVVERRGERKGVVGEDREENTCGEFGGGQLGVVHRRLRGGRGGELVGCAEIIKIRIRVRVRVLALVY